MRQEISTRSSITQVVEKIARLQQLIESNRRDNVGHAKEIGEGLLGVDPKERPVVWGAAGLKRRTAFDYMAVAAHWPAVQHAASIRQALAIIRRVRAAAGPNARLPFDAPLPFEGRCIVERHDPTRPVRCPDEGVPR